MIAIKSMKYMITYRIVPFHILTHKISFFFLSLFTFSAIFYFEIFTFLTPHCHRHCRQQEKKQQQRSTYVHPYSMPHFIFSTLMCKWKLKQYYSSNNISNLLLVLYQHTHYHGMKRRKNLSINPPDPQCHAGLQLSLFQHYS